MISFVKARGKVLLAVAAVGTLFAAFQNFSQTHFEVKTANLYVRLNQNFLYLWAPNLVTQNQCVILSYYNTRGVIKQRYLHTLPMLADGVDGLRICLPRDFGIQGQLRSTTTSFTADLRKNPDVADQNCDGFVSYVSDQRETIAIGGNFSREPMTIAMKDVFTNAQSPLVTIGRPAALILQNEHWTGVEWTDHGKEPSVTDPNAYLVMLHRPGNISRNALTTIRQKVNGQPREIKLVSTNWSCPTLDEAKDPELNVWMELRKDTINPETRLEVAHTNDVDDGIIGDASRDVKASPKFAADMRKLNEAGVNTLTISPQLGLSESGSTTVLDRYRNLVRTINQTVPEAPFQFVLQPNFFPKVREHQGVYKPRAFRVWEPIANLKTWAKKVDGADNACGVENYLEANQITSSRRAACRDTFVDKNVYTDAGNGWGYTWKMELNAFRDQYVSFIHALKVDRTLLGTFRGIIPWQEPSSRWYPREMQGSVNWPLADALRDTNARVYGFDGWLMETNDPSLDGSRLESEYLYKDFGSVMIHQTYPGSNRTLRSERGDSGLPSIQVLANGIHFWLRGLKNQNKESGPANPIQMMAYLQAYDKGDVRKSCDNSIKGPEKNGSKPTALQAAGFNSNWSMWSEYESQLAALRFYSDKYDQSAVMNGAMFYYYGNFNAARGSGKDHIWPGWELDVPNHQTKCWPRIENSKLIMNQVLGVSARLSGRAI